MTYEEAAVKEALRLMTQGYFVISNSHRTVSRIDDAEKYRSLLIKQGRKDSYSWRDFYRRVLSKDKLTVPHSVKKHMSNSGYDGFRDIPSLTEKET